MIVIPIPPCGQSITLSLSPKIEWPKELPNRGIDISNLKAGFIDLSIFTIVPGTTFGSADGLQQYANTISIGKEQAIEMVNVLTQWIEAL